MSKKPLPIGSRVPALGADQNKVNVVTYEQRVAKMRQPGDEARQIDLSKRHVMDLRRRLKGAPSLDEKVLYTSAIKEAEGVLRKLRLNVFELEDMLEEAAANKGMMGAEGDKGSEIESLMAQPSGKCCR